MNEDKLLQSFCIKHCICLIVFISFIRITSGNDTLIPFKFILLVIYAFYMKHSWGKVKNNRK